MTSVDRAALAAYLRRLGLDDAPEPTLEALVDLHRRHLARIPYENLGIMLGTPPGVDPAECVRRVGDVGRLGYCFHQNGAAQVLLRSLGYAVERRHGQVWTGSPDPEGELNHLVLVVTVPGQPGRWWFDVGLGDGFGEPVRLVDGPFTDGGGFGYALEDVAEGGWLYRHAATGTFDGVLVTERSSDVGAVEAAHRRLSTSADSPFRRMFVAQRRDGAGVETVRGCLWSRVAPDGHEERELVEFESWREALGDGLGLSLTGVDEAALRGLFERMLAAHREWMATRDA